MGDLYRIRFSAIKVRKAALAFIEYADHTNALTVYERTVPKMKKTFWFFDDRMETFAEAFSRTWYELAYVDWNFPRHVFGRHIAEELYDQAFSLRDTDSMDLNDEASKIVTWFDK